LIGDDIVFSVFVSSNSISFLLSLPSLQNARRARGFQSKVALLMTISER
jgi:hypothetical protein